MQFWHMQMYLPDGPEGDPIDSSQMLDRDIPVIGTGEWDNTQCSNFKNEDSLGLDIDDIVLIREGAQVLALCRVTSPAFRNDDLQREFRNVHYRNVEILDWYEGDEPFPQPRKTLERLTNRETDSWAFIHDWFTWVQSREMHQLCIDTLEYKKQVVLQGPPGTGKTRLAKELAFDILNGSESDEQAQFLKNSDQFKIVQFHPSYTYEDFVRGIQSVTTGQGVSFKTINRVLLDLCDKAQQEIEQSTQSVFTDLEQYSEQLMNEFVSGLKAETINIHPAFLKSYGEEGITLSHVDYSDEASGFSISHQRIALEIKYLINSDREGNGYPLWVKLMDPLLRELRELIPDESPSFPMINWATVSKYVLVIDEINRANLSSVLGELIYALEYRGEPIESMYDIDGSREIVIPPNLYIIGTMNTADRSVGSIDYAIRRRFAFLDVLPDRNVIELDAGKKLFDTVASLFDNGTLSLEFDKNDVQLGHSYFIADDGEQLNIKLECEIKPILREYVKDGILLGSATELIENLKVE